MRYAPYGPDLAKLRHAVVAGTPRPDTALTLSHLPGAHTPPALRADTNAEIVLNLLRSSQRAELLDGIDAVTSDRFDADSLLSVWALLEPEAALTRIGPVSAAARAGAFGVSTSDAAAQFVCWVNGFREEERLADPADAYRTMLPLVSSVLDHPREHDLYWIGEFSDIIVATSMLNSGAVQLEEHPELDLAVIETPLDLHDLVRLTATGMFRLLTVRSENTYTLEYRPESWVQYQTRRPLPRIDLRPLAARLNFFERNPGTWQGEPLATRRPRLFLDAGNGRPAPSAIDEQTVVAEVLDFLHAYAGRSDLHWSPYAAGRPEA